MSNKKVVVVTGGASGIGLETATKLIEQGWRVAIADISTEAATQAAAKLGADALGCGCDVTDEESLRRAADTIEAKIGQIFGLVCCAGVAQKPGALADLSRGDIERVFATHVTGTLLTGRVMAERMLSNASAGAIVNIASVVAHSPGPTFAYAPAKAAVLNLTKSMAAEWGRRGIRVNSVSPGWTETPFLTQRSSTESPRNLDQLKSVMLLGRLLRPREIANVCAFLLSDEASGLIGTDIIVDGGFLAGRGYAPYSEGNQ